MLMTNGKMKVTKWNVDYVEGTDHEGTAFIRPALRDEREDAYFQLDQTDWYRKDFLMEKEYPIQSMLDLSTGHVGKETIQFLTEQASMYISNFSVYEKGDFGFFFPVTPEDRPELPEDLQRLLRYANERNCSWCMLDADGSIVSDLPFEDWE